VGLLMSSFLAVTFFVPRCGRCLTPAPDASGSAPHLQEQRIPADLETFLTAAGWEVARPVPRRSRYARPQPDSLCCPGCITKLATAEQAFRDSFSRPLTTTVDMTSKIGPGWVIGQRGEHDETRRRWIVAHRGYPLGMIRQYLRGDGTWSSGWEAFRNTGSVLHRVEAPEAGSWSKKSSFMWRSRDLAAWAVAAGAQFETPLPAWAARPGRKKNV
jgi:hypothetical protein